MEVSGRSANIFASRVVVLECPECDELLMVCRGKLATGHRLNCDHCGMPFTVSHAGLHENDARQWRLKPAGSDAAQRR